MKLPSITATQLILNALRPDQTPASWESDRIGAAADWDDLAVRAIVLGLAPQLHWRMLEWGGAAPVPPRAAAKLSVTYRASQMRTASIYRQLGEALSACAGRGLRPVALKGVHLAARVYRDASLRPMNDIDLLFAPDELSTAESILESLGYGGKHKSAELGPGVTKHTSTFRRAGAAAHTPNPYLSGDAECTIEPHVSLEESWFGLKVDITPGVRERAIETRLDGHPCRVLADEDLLLHLCVHFCFHLIMGAPTMVQLCDLLAATVERTVGRTFQSALSGGLESPSLRRQIDWPVFVHRAIDCRAGPYTLAALTLAQKLLAAPIPESVCEQLASATPAPLRERIARLGLDDILRRTQQKPLTTISQRIGRGLNDRMEAARWAADWRSQMRVWQTALNVGSTDTGRMLLKMNNETMRQ